MGVARDHVLMCEDGDRIELSDEGHRALGQRAGRLPLRRRDRRRRRRTACCGTGGCWPRRAWSWSSSPSTSKTGAIITGPEIITRGWVYAPEAEDLLDEAAEAVRNGIKEALARTSAIDLERLQRHVRKAAGKFVSDTTKRRPMIVPVVMEA